MIRFSAATVDGLNGSNPGDSMDSTLSQDVSCVERTAGTEGSSGAQVFRVQLDGSCEMVPWQTKTALATRMTQHDMQIPLLLV